MTVRIPACGYFFLRLGVRLSSTVQTVVLNGHHQILTNNCSIVVFVDLLQSINSFVFSTLYYCSTVWSNTSKRNIKKLQLVQNFAARIVLGLKKFDHISQGIRSLNWLPVNDKLYLNDAIMMFKCINELVPDYLIGKFTLCSQIHSRNTRQRGQLYLPRCRTTTGQRSFTYRSAKLWNNLGDDVKSLDSVNVFRKRLVNLLLSD